MSSPSDELAESAGHDPQVDGQIAWFRTSRWAHLAGQLVAAPVIALMLWPSADHRGLLTFVAVSELSMLFMGMSFWWPFRTSERLSRFPTLPVVAVAIAKLIQGFALFFIADQARLTQNSFGAGAVLYAVAAGSMVTFGPIRQLSRICLACTLLPFALSMFYFGQLWVSLGTLYFFVVIGLYGIRMTSGNYRELVELRHQAANEAATAEIAAGTDELTGVRNRYGLREFDEQVLTNGVVGMFLDLDDFKPVNDTYGHAAGDEVLKVVASRLENLLRSGDIVARLGGDEFFVLLRGTDKATAGLIGERIMSGITQPIGIGDTMVRVSASLGVAHLDDERLDLDRLLRQSDRAMYAAKADERDQVVWFGSLADAAADIGRSASG